MSLHSGSKVDDNHDSDCVAQLGALALILEVLDEVCKVSYVYGFYKISLVGNGEEHVSHRG